MNPSFTNMHRVPHTRALGCSFVNVGASLPNEDSVMVVTKYPFLFLDYTHGRLGVGWYDAR